VLPTSLAQWVPNGLVSLGTDGFGRSDGRRALRKHFEVDFNAIAWSVLSSLAARGEYDAEKLEKARAELGIDSDKPNPVGE
jgi:pyruvate dehydrogenase E1 component